MKHLTKKLRSARGETLMETLVALLVVVMASALLLTMTSTAGRLNNTAIIKDIQLFDESDLAQRQQGSGSEGVVRTTIAAAPLLLDGSEPTAGPATKIDQTVQYYGNLGGICSYRLPEGEGAP